MPWNISKVTLVIEAWNSDTTWGNPPQYVKRRISFDVPMTDVAFYDAAHERWSSFSEAMWAGGPQFNDVSQEGL
jgi:hypothetical protein